MPLPLQLVLDDPEQIKQMARKGGASTDLTVGRHAMHYRRAATTAANFNLP
jgi:hypothetical protein